MFSRVVIDDQRALRLYGRDTIFIWTAPPHWSLDREQSLQLGELAGAVHRRPPRPVASLNHHSSDPFRSLMYARAAIAAAAWRARAPRKGRFEPQLALVARASVGEGARLAPTRRVRRALTHSSRGLATSGRSARSARADDLGLAPPSPTSGAGRRATRPSTSRRPTAVDASARCTTVGRPGRGCRASGARGCRPARRCAGQRPTRARGGIPSLAAGSSLDAAAYASATARSRARRRAPSRAPP